MIRSAWKPAAAAAVLLALAGLAGYVALRGEVSTVARDPQPVARGAAESSTPFRFLMAYSGTRFGGARGAETEYAEYRSPTVGFGVTVPVLYMRTTRGRAGDWVFDPEFDVERRCNNRRMADDALAEILANAIARQLPTMFVLNGGIWADSSCDAPDWDLNDQLEQDPRNCQWTQGDQVFPDDHLKGLAGAIASPELGRSLTYNVYASEVRRYKRRNLAAAGSRIADFARAHPELFVGVTLDADATINPFFNGEQWYDYNPGTLRQFREWLRSAGPYAGHPDAGVPDLRAYARTRALSLTDVNKLAAAHWTSWDQVDPPRRFPGSPRDALGEGDRAYWDDPWFNEWDRFRKHLVALHYDELSRWASDAGIAADRIYSAQGFAAPFGRNRPFALRIDSAGQNYDSAGVSVQGAKPSHGHLGAILYGKAAANDIPTENGKSLFWNFGRIDPGWGIVEFNTAVLNRPEHRPGYAEAYRAFRDAFNFDAALVTPMAWNGPDGADQDKPGYLPYMAWRNTPAEDAMKDFAISHAGVPRGSRLWTFGSPKFASDDGWRVIGGTLRSQPGSVRIALTGGVASLESPPDQLIRPHAHARLLIGSPNAPKSTQVKVHARLDGEREWLVLTDRTLDSPPGSTSVTLDLEWPARTKREGSLATQLRIELRASSSSLDVDHIALLSHAAWPSR